MKGIHMRHNTKKSWPAFLIGIFLISQNAYSMEVSLLQGEEENIHDSKELEKGFLTFTPPLGWRLADQKGLPSSVKIMVVGQGSHAFPPSINLGTEKYNGSLREYLNMIK